MSPRYRWEWGKGVGQWETINPSRVCAGSRTVWAVPQRSGIRNARTIMPLARRARRTNTSSKYPRSAAAPNSAGLVAPMVNATERNTPNPVPRTSSGRELSNDGSTTVANPSSVLTRAVTIASPEILCKWKRDQSDRRAGCDDCQGATNPEPIVGRTGASGLIRMPSAKNAPNRRLAAVVAELFSSTRYVG